MKKYFKKCLRNISLLALSILTPMNMAIASPATTNFLVTAAVLPACTVAATPLAFGNYVSTADSLQTCTITVTCTPGTTFKVGLNAGVNGTVTSARKLKGTATATLLNYFLYLDSARTTNWDNAAPNWSTGSAAVANPIATLTVYGKIPSGQSVPVDNYTDFITVNVTYP